MVVAAMLPESEMPSIVFDLRVYLIREELGSDSFEAHDGNGQSSILKGQDN